MTAPWIEQMRAVTVVDAARALGLPVSPPRNANGGAIYGCPSCGRERRHPKRGDKRGALGITQNGRGWRCFECRASGDALTLVSYVRHGCPYRSLTAVQMGYVRDWCERQLGVCGQSAYIGGGYERRLSAPRASSNSSSPARLPPASEVAVVWEKCSRVDSVQAVGNWLAAQSIQPDLVANSGLARALNPGSSLPAWAAFGQVPWNQSGHLLLAPLVDVYGAMRSLLARRVVDGRAPKSVAARGFARTGLVLACGLARQVLATGQVPSWWGNRPLRFEICEGEKKWLMRAVLRGDADPWAPACFGIVSGSWTRSFGERVPNGSQIFIATDPDAAGAEYATAIVRSFAERVRRGEVHVELRDEHVFDGLTVAVRP